MKKTMLLTACLLAGCSLFGQKLINDPYISLQEKRMVFQSWGGWRPSKTFLGLNPHYQAVWGKLANTRNGKYRKGPDIRPLRLGGTQSNRTLLLYGTKEQVDKLKKETEELKEQAEKEILSTSAITAKADPLWFLYYSKELKPLQNYSNPLAGLKTDAARALDGSAAAEWYHDEMLRLQERLQLNIKQDMDRGARILGYHHILLDYRKAYKKWSYAIAEASKRNMRLETAKRITEPKETIRVSWKKWNNNSDEVIMHEIINNKSLSK